MISRIGGDSCLFFTVSFMPIVNCIFTEHNLWLVLLAAALCVVGSTATVRLWNRALTARGRIRFDWFFLAGVTGGASIWATHFIAMLGYRPPAAVTFDAQLTIVSVVIAIVGTAIGFALTSARNCAVSRVVGGATIGLSIAAMHFVGMFAYRVDGIVHWSAFYIGLSIVLAIGFSILSTWLMTGGPALSYRQARPLAIGALVVAIVTLHFTGMTAFNVTPMPGFSVGADSDAFNAMAMAVAVVALIIVFTGLSSQMIDDKNRERSQEDLLHIATHDELTGLPNRRRFSEELARQCERLAVGRHDFAVVMIDLDRFKPVNDTLGHSIGDKVLQRIAHRLKNAVRSGDLLARLGGDEFAIVAPRSTNEKVALERICERIVDVLSRPIIIDGHVIDLGASLGVAMAPCNGTTPDELSQNADIALYAAKDAGRSRYQVYESSMSTEIQLRRSLERDLRKAVNREEFEVHYQAQVDAESGAYTGAEALIRWKHPEKGMLSPAVFIPLAEELGLIGAIGTWVLKKACADAAAWPEHMSVAVNLSPVQMMDRRLPRIVKNILDDTGLAPSRLELEITETAIIGNDVQALVVLNEIRALGIAISLDDFGTGYSSLSYLHRFPIDKIKIDRSFIDRVPHDADSVSIIQAITKLGASLGMKITAEGIENETQKLFSRSEGCDKLQGYLISKPIPVAELKRLFGSGQSEMTAA